MIRAFICLAAAACIFNPKLASAQGNDAMMVVEAHSGKVLIAKNSTVKRPVASLTKIATGVMVVDWAEAAGIDLDTREAVVPPAVATSPGANPMNLQPGERLTLRNALYSTLLGSDNMAALTLADHVGREFLARKGRSGDPIAAFIVEMNHLAEALEMKKTTFINPHGLEINGKAGLSTAADMAKLSIYAMRRPGFTFMSRQKERKVSVTGAEGARAFNLKNTNELVSDVILGVKTGTTQAAGECLSISVERDPLIRTKPDGSKGVTPRRLMIVLLNTPNRFDRAKSLIPSGWAVYDQWVNSGAPIKDRNREILNVPNPR
ncbi:D-alanyl-D-alanine carboxypeptidase family protein [Haloferula chungangensis]|uniref:D-alanyl-D-alanine carboxypeptidase family protein n=1 Tax=Haloferula chungangensis TaxID=1048331 RepID=A0ABW2L3P9_9BACT